MKQDNCIEWIFEKIFDSLTNHGKDIYQIPYQKIDRLTFKNTKIAQLISEKTCFSLEMVINYLQDISFQNRFLFYKTENILHVNILLNIMDDIHDYQIDDDAIILTMINNLPELFLQMIKTHPLNNSLLYHAVTSENDFFYFTLKEKGLIANSSVYKNAVINSSVKVIQDINETIAFSDKIVQSALEANNTQTILFLLETSLKDGVKLDKKIVHYPIINQNFQVIGKMESLGLLVWEPECYYAALLSGSMEMIQLVETKLDKIHQNLQLDQIKHEKGMKSLILDDIIYHKEGKKYFAHTMNYAIQSRNIDVVKYIYQLDYGISVSNFITAITQSTLEITQFLAERYFQQLPLHVINYFDVHLCAENKMEKFKLLLDYRLLDLQNLPKNVNNFKINTAHREIIQQRKIIDEYQSTDPDYLLQYSALFPQQSYHHVILRTLVRIGLITCNYDYLHLLYQKFPENKYRQIFYDVIYLFGNLNQIKLFPGFPPSITVLMETLCYCQIAKTNYIYKQLTQDIGYFDQAFSLVTMLGNEHIIKLFRILFPQDYFPKIQDIINSKNREYLLPYLNKQLVLDVNLLQKLAFYNDLEILLLIDLSAINHKLIKWCQEKNLLRISSFFTKKMINSTV